MSRSRQADICAAKIESTRTRARRGVSPSFEFAGKLILVMGSVSHVTRGVSKLEYASTALSVDLKRLP
jgi:hypothetical protein